MFTIELVSKEAREPARALGNRNLNQTVNDKLYFRSKALKAPYSWSSFHELNCEHGTPSVFTIELVSKEAREPARALGNGNLNQIVNDNLRPKDFP